MIEEIKRKYGDFADALISQVCYSRNVNDNGVIEITLGAMNVDEAQEDTYYEYIKLILSDISTFRFVEMNNTSSLIIFEAILIEENGVITLDFFPEISDSGTTINEESDFLIRCNHIAYTNIESLTSVI